MRLLLVLLLVLGGVPAASAAGDPPVQQLHRSWSFDGAGAGVLLLQGNVAFGARGGVFASVAGDATGSGRPASVVYFASLQDLGGPDGATHGALGDRDLCADPVTTCRLGPDGDLSFTSTFLVTGSATTQNNVRFSVYLEGERVQLTDTLLRWRRTPVGGARRVEEGRSDSTGLRTGGTSASLLLGARASGGRRGSTVLAAPPCTTVGAGVAVLTGPGVRRDLVCPTGVTAAVTGRGGTWALSGPVAGVAEQRTRLLVLDAA